MIKSIEVTGKTEDEALESALKQLGLERDAVSIEVLERAKSGFLGIGASPAKLRVSYEYKESKQEAVTAFLMGLFDKLDVKAELKTTETEDGSLNVIVEGENIGTLIGRRGETLDAIQHLTNYAVNKGNGDRVRVNIDAENYREKRAEALERLAQKVAAKVVKYNRNVTLEPMNAYERHVIHTALQDFEGVTTYSTGTEPTRRVVVACDRPAKSSGGRRGGRSSERPERREKREPVEAQETPVVEEQKVPDAPSKYASREWA